MDPLIAIDRYGLPIVVVVLLAYFIKKDIWPFLTQQIVKWQDDRTTERKEYTRTLQTFTHIAEQQHNAHYETMQNFGKQLEHLANAITDIAVVVREMKATEHFTAAPPLPPKPRRND